MPSTTAAEKPRPIAFGPYGQDYLRSKADENFTGSARGASKTFVAIIRMIQRMRMRKGYRGLFFRSTIKQLYELTIPEFKKAIELLQYQHMFKVSSNPANLSVTYPAGGSRVSFSAAETSEDAERFQGGNIHDVDVDEAQNIPPVVMERIPAICRTTVGDYKPSLTWLANPNGPGHAWLRRRFIDPARAISLVGNIDHPDWTHPITGEVIHIGNHWRYDVSVQVDTQTVMRQHNIWLIKTKLNPAIDYYQYIAQLKESLKDNYTLASQWIDNDWEAMSGQFYPNLYRAAVDKLSIYPYDRIICSIDQGQRKTAAVWAAVDNYGVYKVFDSRVYHHMDIPDKVSEIRGQRDRVELYIIDPSARQSLEGSGVRTVKRLYQESGLNPLVLCRSNDRHAGWEALRTGFNDGTIIIDKSRCKPLLDSLAALVTKDTDSEDCEKDDGTDWQDDGDHLSDALRYLVVNGFYVGEAEDAWDVRETERIMMSNPGIRDIMLRNSKRYGR